MPKSPSQKRSAAKKEKPEKAEKGEKVEKAPRKPSAYNLFMKTELPKVKIADPTITHKDAFKVAAGNWKTAAENPANKK
ncbi:hypothetical protein HDU98_006254 [Podochytrium sp. JEL0797]|nr:hypothetical protein HDU98_006254 [Podochytrium sp. JEL0797]